MTNKKLEHKKVEKCLILKNIISIFIHATESANIEHSDSLTLLFCTSLKGLTSPFNSLLSLLLILMERIEERLIN